ncbi:MAG: FG-GAP repeat domain-containing protein, partial [Planctomycetota bacterium]
MTFVNRCALFSVCALLCSLPSSTTAQSGPPVPAPPGPAPAAEPLFEDVGDALGLAGEKAKLVTLYDLDRDGWPDITLDGTRMYVSRKARLEDGSTGRYFKRWAADKPLNKEGVRRPTGVHFADVNNDGRTDLYVLRSTDLSNAKFKDDGLRSEIWLGTRKSFRKLKSSVVGKQAETTITATFVDADHDGRLDLFTGAAYTRYGKSLEAFPDRLYGGLGDGKFEDRTEAAGLLLVAEPGRADSRRPSYGVTHADWNNDGLPDLFTMSYGRQWNRLWKNNGDGTFTDVAPGSSYDGDAERDGRYPAGINRAKEAPFRSNGNSFDAAIADYDHDGDLDLFLAEITHAWAGKSSDKSMLLENLGPEKKFGFKRHPDAVQRDQVGNRWNQGDLHAGWLDLDNDGLLD